MLKKQKNVKKAKEKLKKAALAIKVSRHFSGKFIGKNIHLKRGPSLNLKKIEKIETNEAEKQEFDSLCSSLGINEATESLEIVKMIKRFVKSKLDVCWSKEEDENGIIIYYYKPDNFSTYEHPHLYRLKNAIYDYREEEYKQQERDNMEKNIMAVQQIQTIKQVKAALRKEKDTLRKLSEMDNEKKKGKKGKKGKKDRKGTKNAKNGKSSKNDKSGKNDKNQDNPTAKQNLSTILDEQTHLNEEKVLKKSKSNLSINQNIQNAQNEFNANTNTQTHTQTQEDTAQDSSRAKDSKKNKKKKEKSQASQKQKELENTKALLEKGMYILSKVNSHPIKQTVLRNQGNNLKMRVIENKKFTSKITKNSKKSMENLLNNPDIFLAADTQKNYSSLEQFYIHCYQYYVTRYGFPMRKIPKSLLPSMEDAFNDVYRNAAEVEDSNTLSTQKHHKERNKPKLQTRNDKRQPQNMEKIFQNLWNLNINPHETKYYPYALVLNYLPLPPGVQIFGNRNNTWMFNGEKFDNCHKPGMLYLLKNLEFFRSQDVEESTFHTTVEEPSGESNITSKKQKIAPKSKLNLPAVGPAEDEGDLDQRETIWREHSAMAGNMRFWDGMGREYTVDLVKEYRKWFRNPNIAGNNEVHLTKFYKKDMFSGKDLQKLKKQREQNLREYIQDSWGKDKSDKVSTNVTDMHFLEIMKQLDIDPKRDLYLLYPIQEFVRDKENDNPWEFRIKPDGKKCWLNKKQMSVSFKYPYLNALKLKIAEYQKEFNLEATIGTQKRINILDFMLVDRSTGHAKLKENKQKVYRIMESYFNSYQNMEDYMRIYKQMEKIQKNVNRLLLTQLVMEDFITLIFFCDFDLESWVVKNCQGVGKKDQVFMKNVNPDRYILQKYDLIKTLLKAEKNQGSPARFSRLMSGERLGSAYSNNKTISKQERRRRRKRQIGEFVPLMDDLGPLEDYLYLIDPSLKQESVIELPDINKLIRDSMHNLEKFEMLIEECDELIHAMKGLDESHLNDLIRKINNLYNKLELENTNIPMTRLQALEALKMKAIMKRNRMRGNQLRLNDDYSVRIEKAIKNRSIKKLGDDDENQIILQKAHSDIYIESETESIEETTYKAEESKKMKDSKNDRNEESTEKEDTHDFFKTKKKPDAFLKVKKREVKRRASIQFHFDPNRSKRRSSKWFLHHGDIHELSQKSKSRQSGSIFNKSRLRTNDSRKSSTHLAEEEIDKLDKKNAKMLNNLIQNKKVSELFKEAIMTQAKLSGMQTPNRKQSKSNNQTISMNTIDGEEEGGDFSLDMAGMLEKIATDNPDELKKILNEHSELTEAEKTKLMESLAKTIQLKSRQHSYQMADSPLSKRSKNSKSSEPKQLFSDIGKIGNAGNDMGLGIKLTSESAKSKTAHTNSKKSEEEDDVFNRLYKQASIPARDAKLGLIDHIESEREANRDALYNQSKIRTIRDLIKVQDKYNNILTQQDGSQGHLMVSGHGSKRIREFLVPMMDEVHWYGEESKKNKNNGKEVELEQPTLRINNILSNIEKQLEIEIEIQKRQRAKISTNSKHEPNVYSRINQNMPFRLINKGIYRSKIENFILDWFEEKLGVSKKKVTDLRTDLEKRARFFRATDGFFERVIDIIMKNPKLASQACNFVFDKDKNRNQEEALKLHKKREILQRQKVIQHRRHASNPFMPHQMTKIQYFTGKGRNSSPFMIKRSYSQGKIGPKNRGLFNFKFLNEKSENQSHYKRNFSLNRSASRLYQNRGNRKNEFTPHQVEHPLHFLKDIENEIVATGNKFQLPKIDLGALQSSQYYPQDYPQNSHRSTKADSNRTATTRRQFYRQAAQSSRTFFLKHTNLEQENGRGKYHKPKKHLRFNLAQSLRKSQKEINPYTKSLSEKFGPSKQVNRLVLNGLKNQKLKLSSLNQIYEICWWLGIKCQKPLNLNAIIQEHLAKEQLAIDSGAKNIGPSRSHKHKRSLSSIYFSSREDSPIKARRKTRISSQFYRDTASKFVIDKKMEEGDLVWVAILILMHYNQYINITQEISRNWDMELEYFRSTLQKQREKRAKLFRKLGLKKRNMVIRALSWVSLCDTVTNRWYNFNFVTKEMKLAENSNISKLEASLITKFFNYQLLSLGFQA